MAFSPLLEQLIKALRCLPGVGPKSAQRMAFYVLERNRSGGKQLAHTLLEALEQVGHCHNCRTFSETNLCKLCSNSRRDPSLLCIVETPADILAIEQTASFSGMYFVLMGHLSPLDGIGPNEIGIPQLRQRLMQDTIKEIILATNPTVEGEATAHYIANLAKEKQIKTTRIAHGIPIGGELDNVDNNTLAHALQGRLEL